MLRLSDIMTTDVLTLGPELSVREAMGVLTTRRVSGAPVVEHGTVVGVISTTDLLAFAAEHADAEPIVETPSDAELPPEEWDDSATIVEEGPTAAYYVALVDDSTEDVWAKMDEARGETRSVLDERTVRDIMTPRVHSMRPEETVTAAADYMRTARVHRLLVLDSDGQLAGLVTTMDIARAVADHRIVNRTFVFEKSPDTRTRGHGVTRPTEIRE